ncbi:glycosyl hydrolase 115 family protein [[Clostridium] polysaccharolyticum]|uniref:Glycosyl hydrolase family 115 n=1 Tax=[Clostridium] polysaccharolyticum TaxID=29364 RepID=A0A1H9ZM37_9FIRM|nr:glycosyl hydrolase 115 family protein [[Clostridium] polysaccharolyticum]SES82801.1 Glycosyl hydrolase family 115 [[Clostridium] polysaccharolyticum]
MGKKEFELVKDGVCAPIIIETTECEGVRKIAEKSANDICLVTGITPEIVSENDEKSANMVLYTTVKNSKLVTELCKRGKLSAEQVAGKREVYGIQIIEQPWEGTEKLLVIYGSEKRGTIYGIFALSEYIGVSPLVFFGDAKPKYQEELVIDEDIQGISKEPSVKYRGFFINDEWPCFGNWTFDHFGGFTAKMYDKVFELLLRLKGNYLWPAMWTSSFALDGPGEENARLADMYGVIMGNSHHEPCLRASEEWDIYRGENTPYGNAWNYVANKEGLLNYWKDGLIRSSKYENIITMGMRGERDSIMEGTKTLQDNINVLKDIITEQLKLIEKYGDKKMPRLLAIYKEVERYFYGDGQTEGLRSWEGLEDMILMFCEDNYGNMRMLPDKEMQAHKGGFGMYYHFDYHGSPVSYEWVNSTPLSKIWEQMTECYEYGVREVWIVNVGDLKGNEFPLSYFMNLAYDFDTWGTACKESPKRFTEQWIALQFYGRLSKEEKSQLADLLTKGIWLANLRKPESLHSYVFHPAHYGETDRMLDMVSQLIEQLENLLKNLPEDCKDAYYSMIYYPLRSSMNLIQMQLYAGKNEHYAKQGKKIANEYAKLVTEAIAKDKALAKEFSFAFDGKWKGMELGKHIGFRKWNEDGCRYPLRMQVEPFDRPRLVVSRKDQEAVHVKNYGQPERIAVDDFLYPGTEWVDIEAANDGIGTIHCTVTGTDCRWLALNWTKQDIEQQEVLRISCNREALPETKETICLELSDGDTVVAIEVSGQKKQTAQLPEMTFYEKDGVVAILATHYAECKEKETGRWIELEDYGKSGCGMKAEPVTENFTLGKGPSAVYRAYVEQEGAYTLEVRSAPSNPLESGGKLQFGLRVNEEPLQAISSVSETYAGGAPENAEWSEGILAHMHKTDLEVILHEGVNEFEVFAMDAGFVLEELLVVRKDKNILPSYLGPEESWHV